MQSFGMQLLLHFSDCYFICWRWNRVKLEYIVTLFKKGHLTIVGVGRFWRWNLMTTLSCVRRGDDQLATKSNAKGWNFNLKDIKYNLSWPWEAKAFATPLVSTLLVYICHILYFGSLWFKIFTRKVDGYHKIDNLLIYTSFGYRSLCETQSEFYFNWDNNNLIKNSI